MFTEEEFKSRTVFNNIEVLNMKILYIITGLSTGGAEMMLYKLLSIINRAKFKPSVLSLTDEGSLGKQIKELGIPVYSLKMKGGFPSPVKLVQLIRLVKKISPDLIQGWMYHGNVAASFVKWFSRKNIILLWNIRHTQMDLKKEKPLTAIVIRIGAKISSYPDQIIYNSRISEKKHKSLGYEDRNKKIISNGFDCKKFKPDKDAKKGLLQLLDIPEDSLLIGLIARYHEMKDHRTFLNVAGKLVSINPKIHFILAGSEIDQRNYQLIHQIKELNIMKQVHLLGERKDIARITAGLDIACSTSSWGEGFSNAIGEAMACEVPCVATDVGDSAWIIGNTGFVVKAGNMKALTDAFLSLIEMGLEKRKKIGQLARDRIKKNFSIDVVAKQYEDAYQGIVNKRYSDKI